VIVLAGVGITALAKPDLFWAQFAIDSGPNERSRVPVEAVQADPSRPNAVWLPPEDAAAFAGLQDSYVAEAVAPSLPPFSQFAVRETNHIAELQLAAGSWFWNYRTRIRDAFKAEANFGSNAVVTTWGCGTGCQFGALVDRSTGTVHDIPVGGEEQQMLEVRTQRGSTLMLATWNDFHDTGAACVFEAFVWTEGVFEALDGFPKKMPGTCSIVY
jgi:hypothetical protein